MTLHQKQFDLTPIAGQLIGETITGDYETSSGLIVVQDLKKGNWPRKVRIVAVGGKFFDTSEIEQSYSAAVGDTVWIRKNSGKELRHNRKDYLCLDNQFIIAIETPQGFTAPRDMVIVEPHFEEKNDLIYIPENTKEYQGNFYGIVHSVGPRYPWALGLGEKIAFRRHEGTPIERGGKKFLSLKAAWVDAVINN